MIALLRGSVILKHPAFLIIDVKGVGYKVYVANGLLSTIAQGDQVTLFIHTYVRDDALELYGFLTEEDLRIFELLISVSGVGCKSALGVFSVGDRSSIVNAVVAGDVGFFTAVPRLGKKNGQKIIIELKNKLGGIEDLDLSATESTERGEAISALLSFGYSRREAESAVGRLKGESLKTEEIIRQALKQLGK